MPRSSELASAFGCAIALAYAVSVSDGRLTLRQGNAADKATRINYIEASQP